MLALSDGAHQLALALVTGKENALTTVLGVLVKHTEDSCRPFLIKQRQTLVHGERQGIAGADKFGKRDAQRQVSRVTGSLA